MSKVSQPERTAQGAADWLEALASKLGSELVAELGDRIEDEYTSWGDALRTGSYKRERAAAAWHDAAASLKALGLTQWGVVADSVVEANANTEERIQAGEQGGFQGFKRAVEETAQDVTTVSKDATKGSTRYLPYALGAGTVLGMLYLAVKAGTIIDPLVSAVSAVFGREDDE